MRHAVLGLLLATALAGCASHAASNRSQNGTLPPGTTKPGGSLNTPTVRSSPAPPRPVATATSAPRVATSTAYVTFLSQVCHAFSTRDTQALEGFLPYYQYNSGIRYGSLGDGEGQTADPGMFSTWLQTGHVSCRSYTVDRAGHGTLLTSGWSQLGGWSLIDLDTYNGVWKFNDFTFGSRAALYQAMQTSHPILPFHAA